MSTQTRITMSDIKLYDFGSVFLGCNEMSPVTVVDEKFNKY